MEETIEWCDIGIITLKKMILEDSESKTRLNLFKEEIEMDKDHFSHQTISVLGYGCNMGKIHWKQLKIRRKLIL